MFGLSSMVFVVDAIIIIAFLLKKLGRAIDRYGGNSLNINDDGLFYGYNCEKYNEPILLLSPHNSASEIVRKDGLFYVTIENSVTGDKQTLCNKNKWFLCMDAEAVATKFAVKERDEYHTV